MKVTFIYHSSFLAETESRYLLFDYVQGAIPEMNQEKPVFVFASHRHGDHFSMQIFELAKKYPHIWFILSDDILKERVPDQWKEQTVFLGPDQTCELEGMKVETLKSTDEGVAFLIRSDGQRIFHAGDLNDWYWEREPEKDNAVMTKAFRDQINKLEGCRLDTAFVVLDPRQEKNYDRGIRYFLEHVSAEKVFPMHCWGDESVIGRCRQETWAFPYQDCIMDMPG